MTPGDLATLSLLDADQGVCPSDHPCRLDERRIERRRCSPGEYSGMALICWEITFEAIAQAAEDGADATLVEWATSFVADRELAR